MSETSETINTLAVVEPLTLAPIISTAAEANELHRRLGETLIRDGLAIGEFVHKQHQAIKYGEWDKWVQANLEFSRTTAFRYEQLWINRDRFTDETTSVDEAYRMLGLKEPKGAAKKRTGKKTNKKTDKPWHEKIEPDAMTEEQDERLEQECWEDFSNWVETKYPKHTGFVSQTIKEELLSEAHPGCGISWEEGLTHNPTGIHAHVQFHLPDSLVRKLTTSMLVDAAMELLSAALYSARKNDSDFSLELLHAEMVRKANELQEMPFE